MDNMPDFDPQERPIDLVEHDSQQVCNCEVHSTSYHATVGSLDLLCHCVWVALYFRLVCERQYACFGPHLPRLGQDVVLGPKILESACPKWHPLSAPTRIDVTWRLT